MYVDLKKGYRINNEINFLIPIHMIIKSTNLNGKLLFLKDGSKHLNALLFNAPKVLEP